MAVTSTADLTRRQASYSPDVNELYSANSVNQGFAFTPDLYNPTINQGEITPIQTATEIEQGGTKPVLPDVIIKQGETTPVIPNPRIEQGETEPIIPEVKITQGETDVAGYNPIIEQGEITPKQYNPIINQGETDVNAFNIEIDQGTTKINSIDLEIKQGETDPVTPNPTINQGTINIVEPNVIIKQGETDPVIPNPNIEQGTINIVIPETKINQGEIDLKKINPDIIQGETDPVIPNPRIEQGGIKPVSFEPIIEQGKTDPVIPDPNINQGESSINVSEFIPIQGETTPTIPNPTIIQGETTPTVPNPNIEQGSTDPVIPSLELQQGETTPTVPNPIIVQGETTPVIPVVNIQQGETTPTVPNPIIAQGETTPVIPVVNIQQGETTPTVPNPNIEQGSTDPVIPNPNIEQGETTPVIPNPNIEQGETTPVIPVVNIQQGETTPIIPNPEIIQGETTPTVPVVNVQQGETTPVIPNPNIEQGETDPVIPNPNIIQGETTPVIPVVDIVQGETTPTVPNPNIVQGETTPVIPNPRIEQGSVLIIPSDPKIVQGSVTIRVANPNIQQGSTTPTYRFGNNVTNSITFAENQNLPLQTLPIISQTISGLAGVNIPIIGGASLSGVASGVLSATNPVAAQVVSAANYLANLPLSLYRRPEGLILIANQVANIAFSQFMTRRDKILDGERGAAYQPDTEVMIRSGLSNVLSYEGILPGDEASIRTGGPEVWKHRSKIFIDKIGISLGPEEYRNNTYGLLKNPFESSGFFGNTGDTLNKDLGWTQRDESTAIIIDNTINESINITDSIVSPIEYQPELGSMYNPDVTGRFNGISPNGGILTPTEFVELNNQQIQIKNGIFNPVKPVIDSEIKYTPNINDTKKVLEKFRFRISNADASPVSSLDVVDPLMDSVDSTTEDFVNLKFRDLRDRSEFQFRSYITSFNDRFNPTFSDVTYIGRPNPLKIFSNTSRDVSMDLMVPALSRGELKTMYAKLQKLVNLTMPTDVGVMVGPTFEFTLGDYFDKEICHISSLTFSVEDEYPWEVNIEKSTQIAVVPHIIKVSLGIYIIGNKVMTTTAYKPFGTAITL